jgi:hypothetical protein
MGHLGKLKTTKIYVAGSPVEPVLPVSRLLVHIKAESPKFRTTNYLMYGFPLGWI